MPEASVKTNFYQKKKKKTTSGGGRKERETGSTPIAIWFNILPNLTSGFSQIHLQKGEEEFR